MSLYYDSTGELREIDDNLVAGWIAAGNPKASVWTLAPLRPSEAHKWNGSAWVLPPEQVPESVTARQIRLWLVTHGVSLDAVSAAIQAIPDAAQRATVAVEWEYAPYIERAHPMLLPLAAALGMTSEQVDTAFREAAAL